MLTESVAVIFVVIEEWVEGKNAILLSFRANSTFSIAEINWLKCDDGEKTLFHFPSRGVAWLRWKFFHHLGRRCVEGVEVLKKGSPVFSFVPILHAKLEGDDVYLITRPKNGEGCTKIVSRLLLAAGENRGDTLKAVFDEYICIRKGGVAPLSQSPHSQILWTLQQRSFAVPTATFAALNELTFISVFTFSAARQTGLR